jgi:hypothetical protein
VHLPVHRIMTAAVANSVERERGFAKSAFSDFAHPQIPLQPYPGAYSSAVPIIPTLNCLAPVPNYSCRLWPDALIVLRFFEGP